MKRKFLLLYLFVNLVIGIQATVREPYLEVPTSTSVWINWKSDIEKNFTIRYGTSPSSMDQVKSIITQTWTDNGYDNNYLYSTAHLTNLTANTKYYYKITDMTGYESPVYNFRTYPSPGESANNGKTRFLILGDNQLKDEPRFDTLEVKAKRFIEKKYGAPIQDVISSVIMNGDQVDVGTLDHYENVHFKKNRYISPYLGISTVIGNHETYGTLKLDAYYNHFHYDSLQYKVASGTKDYYAYQAGNLLVINLFTDASTGEYADQFNWLKRVVTASNADPTVKWIVSVAHRPYQAEQYVGDISTWIRNTAYPLLITSPKMFMNIGAHHHLYARGQDKNKPVYNIISGGTAWDQYWGMSTEKDYDDVQKTIPRWAYQILEIDHVTDEAKVYSYSVGYTTKINDWGNLDKFVWEESTLIDSFYVRRNLAVPATPAIQNVINDSIELPYTFISTPYSTPSNERYNSTQFQISQSADFSTLTIDNIRDFEDWYGKDGEAWQTKDVNKDIDIFKLTPGAKTLLNGTYYIRVRHRDRALNWSEWSNATTFKIKKGMEGKPQVLTNKKEYALNENVQVNYANGPGNEKDWVGVYLSGQTPGEVNSTVWSYVNSASRVSGILNMSLPAAGAYYAVLLENDGYNELSERTYFYVGSVPTLAVADATNDTIKISYSNAPANAKDWIGIYKIGNDPQNTTSAAYQYIPSANSTLTFTSLGKGYYFARYFLNDGYASIGNEIYFSVGDTIATISTDIPSYDLGDLISVTFNDGPGIAKDWLGIFNKGANPNINPLLNYIYVSGKPSGTATFQADNIPTKDGDYYVVFFTNDSYNEISNRAYFSIKSVISDASTATTGNSGRVYPNPSSPGKQTIVSYNYPIDQIDIYNTAGTLLYSKLNKKVQNTVILNHSLPAGVYYIKVHSNKLYTHKLIVNAE